jgi:hypothetical protein
MRPGLRLLEVFREHRVRNDLDVRHGMAELEQAAGHVVVGRHQAQRGEALLGDPGGGLSGVATGVVGIVPEAHATGELVRRLLPDAKQLRHVDTAIDP